MSPWKKLSRISVLLIILLTGFHLSGFSKDADYDPWGWSKKNVNTGWMEWGEKYWPTKPVRGGIYHRAAAVYVGYMNPNHWPVNDWTVIVNIYEGLNSYDGNYKQRFPWMVESYEFTSPTTVIMKLKKGIRFHDGTDFNAKSLKYTFDWIGDKRNGTWTISLQSHIKSLEVISEHTLKWTTKKPWGNYPVGFFGFQISEKALRGDIAQREAKNVTRKLVTLQKKVDKAKAKLKKAQKKGNNAVKKAAKKLKKEEKKLAKGKQIAEEAQAKAKGHRNTDVFPVGTGSFMFDEASPGNYVKLKRNPDWWFGQSVGHPEMPYFDGMRITVIPDPSIRLANLRSGKIDSMGMSKAQYLMVKRDPNMVVYTSSNNYTSTLMFNSSSGPCKDIRVRKAIAHAIDRRALIAGTQFGLARIASSIFPDDHWAHNPSLKPVTYDPELSKQLLIKAGYGDGLTLKGVASNLQDEVTITTAIRSMFNKVGINWKVDALDPAARGDRIRNLEYDVAVSGRPYIQDPDGPTRNFYHPNGPWNYGRNNNPRLVELIESGQATLDQNERQKIYHQAEEEIYNNYMDVFLFWDIQATVYRKRVLGWNNEMWIKHRTLYSGSHPQWFKDGKRRR